jgi:hypothetical protein
MTVLTEGLADFTIEWIEQHVSRAGNLSIKLKLKLVKDDQTTIAYEYLSHGSRKRLQSFCDSLQVPLPEGRLVDCDNRALLQLKGATGVARIRVEQSDGYPERNRVSLWLKPESKSDKHQQSLDNLQNQVDFIKNNPVHNKHIEANSDIAINLDDVPF